MLQLSCFFGGAWSPWHVYALRIFSCSRKNGFSAAEREKIAQPLIFIEVKLILKIFAVVNVGISFCFAVFIPLFFRALGKSPRLHAV